MYRVTRTIYGVVTHRNFESINELCNYLDSRSAYMDRLEGATFEVEEVLENEESKL